MAGRCVAILDAGSQFGKRFDRALRSLSVESHLLPLDASLERVREYGAVIITGSPGSVLAEDAPRAVDGLFSEAVPMLGVCYGMQLMNHMCGGRISSERRVDGQFDISVDTSCALFEGLDTTQRVLLTHGDAVASDEAVASGFRAVAHTESGVVAAIASATLPHFGVQFHPEVDLTENGVQILSNFLFGVAKLTPSYTPQCREQLAIEYIREVVGDRRVLSMVSGGVDSSVCTALLARAIGAERVLAVHVDNGFMRHEESATVKRALADVGVDVHVVEAGARFFEAVASAADPEQKRKAIGDTFVRVANDAARSFGLDVAHFVLAQGTLRPDLIESASSIASSRACAIKTHHNDTDMVRALRDLGRVVEPLQDYHKDEVRELGARIGLPDLLVWRQPFPGPGLAIRVLQHHTYPPAADVEAIESGIQSLALPEEIHTEIIPVRSVGVQGDGRTYAYAVCCTHSAFDGSAASAPWPLLMSMAKRIPSVCRGVNRVVFLLRAHKRLAFRSTETPLAPHTVAQVRAADHVVNSVIARRRLVRSLAQMPVVLLPARLADATADDARCVVLRPFITNDFMTGVPAVPGTRELPHDALDEMLDGLYALPWLSGVLYDLTAKPPGTTEWE